MAVLDDDVQRRVAGALQADLAGSVLLTQPVSANTFLISSLLLVPHRSSGGAAVK